MDFKLLIQKIESLPSLPQAYHKCCFLLEREVTDSKDLAQVVATDPAMAIAVLKLVNSAFYNIPRKIERLEHAISIIGHAKFRDLILTAAVVKAMSNLASGQVDMEVFWRHSIYTALVGKRLALHAYQPNSERLFLAGLLHDIGQLIYFDLLETKAVKVSTLITKLNVNVSVAEKKVLGFTHQDVASALCQRWELPEWLEQTVKYYDNAQESMYYKQEAKILLLANAIAEQHYPSLASLGKPQKTSSVIIEDVTLWQQLNVDKSLLTELTDESNAQLQSVVESLVPDLSCVN